MRAAAALLLLAGAAEAQDGWVAKASADLVLLDKIRGQPSAVSVKAGDSTSFGSITVTVRSCMVRPPDQPADATAFVEVKDTRGTTGGFSGWILQNEPGISQMQHPVYDLRLVGCH